MSPACGPLSMLRTARWSVCLWRKLCNSDSCPKLSERRFNRSLILRVTETRDFIHVFCEKAEAKFNIWAFFLLVAASPWRNVGKQGNTAAWDLDSHISGQRIRIQDSGFRSWAAGPWIRSSLFTGKCAQTLVSLFVCVSAFRDKESFCVMFLWGRVSVVVEIQSHRNKDHVSERVFKEQEETKQWALRDTRSQRSRFRFRC